MLSAVLPGGDLQRHDLVLVVDGEVQLEAVKPLRACFAACRQTFEHLVVMDTAIVADGKLG